VQLKRRDLAYRLVDATSSEVPDLYLWNWSFYGQMLKRESHSVNGALVAQYFEGSNTLKNMLGIFERLFGMRFDEVEGPNSEGVRIFTAWNDESGDGSSLGHLYLEVALEGEI
jgi:Zn-dependent oligopeptidase